MGGNVDRYTVTTVTAAFYSSIRLSAAVRLFLKYIQPPLIFTVSYTYRCDYFYYLKYIYKSSEAIINLLI